MPNTTVATGTFHSRKEANQAIQRLVANGFARNSIELHGHDDGEGFELEVHTRRDNLKRVKRLIRGPSAMQSVGQSASKAVKSATAHPVMLLGAGLLAGYLIYNLLPRGTMASARSRLSGSRDSHNRRGR